MLRAALVMLALSLAGGAMAQTPEKPKPAAEKSKDPEKAKPAAKAKAPGRPAWAELTADQQMVLAPLKADWEKLEAERRGKWIGIANRYPKMKTEERSEERRVGQERECLWP